MADREIKLDIGCGQRKRDGFVGVDVSAHAAADVLANPEKALPFADNIFSAVWMNHVFEHLDNPVNVMNEIWRVCKPGAKVEIRGPHYSSPHLVWSDPTHKRGLSLSTFQYFDGSWWDSPGSRFGLVSCSLKKSNTTFRDVGWRFWYWPFVIPNFCLDKIVNASPSWISRYERLASRFIRFEEIWVVLSVEKNPNIRNS